MIYIRRLFLKYSLEILLGKIIVYQQVLKMNTTPYMDKMNGYNEKSPNYNSKNKFQKCVFIIRNIVLTFIF